MGRRGAAVGQDALGLQVRRRIGEGLYSVALQETTRKKNVMSKFAGMFFVAKVKKYKVEGANKSHLPRRLQS